MITLAYGTLPTPSYMRIVCRRNGIATDRELLEHLRYMLQRHGPCPYVEASLEALGIAWGPQPSPTDLDLDVARVAEALNSPASPVPAPRHSAAGESGAPTGDTTTAGDAGGWSSPPRRRRESKAHRVEREFYGDVLGED